MKVSVIVPVYNCDKYLAVCLDSILAQTYPVYEIILIDDGSKDESGRICDDYAKKDSRIRVIHQENGGVSRARNVGMSYVTGDAVSFIDSDDTLEPDMYELLVRVMEEHNADIAHCGFNRVEHATIKPIFATGSTYIHTSKQATEKLIQGDLFNGALWNKLYRTEVLRNLWFHERIKNNEDILFNFEAFSKSNVCVFYDVAKYNYFVRENISACFTIPKNKQIQDSLYVNNHIFERVASENGKKLAAERLVRSLSGSYRISIDGTEKRDIAKQIWQIYCTHPNICTSMKITAILIRFFPRVYLYIRRLHEKRHPPVWEI